MIRWLVLPQSDRETPRVQRSMPRRVKLEIICQVAKEIQILPVANVTVPSFFKRSDPLKNCRLRYRIYRATESKMDSQTRTHAAKLLSITSSFLIAGYTFGFSQNGVSELYDERPQVGAPIFKRIYNTGGHVAIPLSISSILSSAYLAYVIPEKRNVWVTATALIVAIRFWTDYVMMPGINRLIRISDDKRVQEKAEQTLEHRQLMVRWVEQNYLRSAAALLSGLAGLWASL